MYVKIFENQLVLNERMDDYRVATVTEGFTDGMTDLNCRNPLLFKS